MVNRITMQSIQSEYDFYTLSSNPVADDGDYNRPQSVCVMGSNPAFYFVRLTFWHLLDKIAP